MTASSPDISLWGLARSYYHRYPRSTLGMLLLSVIFPAESVVSAFLLGSLTSSFLQQRYRRLTMIVAAIATLHVCTIVLYNVDLYMTQMLSISMLTHIQLQLMKFLYFSRVRDPSHLIPEELATKMRIYSQFMTRRLNVIRNDMIPGLLSITMRGVSVGYKIDLGLSVIFFILLGVMFAALYYASSLSVDTASASTIAEENILLRLGDLIANYSLTKMDHNEAMELQSLEQLQSKARMARSKSVLTTIRSVVVVIGVAAVCSLLYFYRVYRLFVSKDGGTQQQSKDVSKQSQSAVTAITMMLDTLENIRSMLYHFYDISYGTAGMRIIYQSIIEDVQDTTPRRITGPLPQPRIASVGTASDGGGEAPVLEICDLDFQYATNKPWIFQKFSAVFPRGSITQIVGPNGSGKTTILRLLTRSLYPVSGAILWCGIPYANIPPEVLCAKIAFASQTATLLNRSIFDNIRYSRPTTSRLEVETFLANIHLLPYFQTNFPKGLDTIVGKGGSSLSGGQRQIVQLARILFKGAEVVILDEATVAIDVHHLQIIQEILDTALSDKTVIFVSHVRDHTLGLSSAREQRQIHLSGPLLPPTT